MEQLFDHFADIGKLDKEKGAIIGIFKEIKAGILDLNTAGIKLDSSKGLGELTKAYQQIETLQNRLATQQTQLDSRMAQARAANARAANSEAQAQLRTAQTTQANTRAKELELRIIERLERQKRLFEAASAREARNAQRLSNEYLQLRRTYDAVALEAKRLAIVQGEGNAQTVAAVAHARQLHEQLSRVEQAVGQAQRNVGNYTQATFALTQVFREAPAFANSFATGISAISNNLPMLIDQFKILAQQTGSNFAALRILGGALLSFNVLLPIAFLLVQSYGKEIATWVKGLFGAKDAYDQLAVKQKLFNEIVKEGAGNAAEQITDLKILYNTATDVNNSMNERLAAAGELQKMFPAYFENIKKEAIANGEAKGSYDSLTLSIQENARAMAARSKLVDIEAQRLQIAQNKANIVATTDAEMGRVKPISGKNFAGVKVVSDESIQGRLEYDKRIIKERRDAALAEQEVQDRRLKAQADFVTQFVGGEKKIAEAIEDASKDKKPKDTSKEIARRLEDERKAALELFKYRMGQDIEEQKALAGAETAGFTQRAQARRKQADLEKELIGGVAKFELMQANITAAERTLIQERALADAAAVASSKQGDLIKIRVQEAQRLRDEALKAAKELDDILAAREAKRIQDAKDQAEISLANTMEQARKVRDAELAVNQSLYAKGLRTKEQYEAQQLKIENEYAIKGINAEIDYQARLLAVAKPEDRADIELKLYELRKKLNDLDVKNFEEAQAKKIDLERQRNAQIKSLAMESAQLLQTLLTSGFENQKNQLADELDRINMVKDADIKRIRETQGTEEEKAAKIKMIEAQTQSQREALDRRQRQLDRRKAEFDRAFKAFQIISSGIENVARIKMAVAELTARAMANPRLLPLIPIAAAQVPISIAISAANLAGLLATPLPRYAKGTDNAPEGFAEVGERGAELGIDKAGKVTLYTAPTIAYLTAGTKILPADATANVLQAIQMPQYTANSTAQPHQPDSPYSKEILDQLKQLTKKSGVHIHNQHGIETSAWYAQQFKR